MRPSVEPTVVTMAHLGAHHVSSGRADSLPNPVEVEPGLPVGQCSNSVRGPGQASAGVDDKSSVLATLDHVHSRIVDEFGTRRGSRASLNGSSVSASATGPPSASTCSAGAQPCGVGEIQGFVVSDGDRAFYGRVAPAYLPRAWDLLAAESRTGDWHAQPNGGDRAKGSPEVLADAMGCLGMPQQTCTAPDEMQAGPSHMVRTEIGHPDAATAQDALELNAALLRYRCA